MLRIDLNADSVLADSLDVADVPSMPRICEVTAARRGHPVANSQMQAPRPVQVWWKDDEAWYTGSVTRYEAHKGLHLVEYDDGDEEEVDLAQEKYEVLPGASFLADGRKLSDGESARVGSAWLDMRPLNWADLYHEILSFALNQSSSALEGQVICWHIRRQGGGKGSSAATRPQGAHPAVRLGRGCRGEWQSRLRQRQRVWLRGGHKVSTPGGREDNDDETRCQQNIIGRPLRSRVYEGGCPSEQQLLLVCSLWLAAPRAAAPVTRSWIRRTTLTTTARRPPPSAAAGARPPSARCTSELTGSRRIASSSAD